MNNKALTLSILMAVIAVFFVQSYVESIEEEARKKFGTEILVVSAKQDIHEMATINETMVELKRVPRRFLEPAAIAFSGNPGDQAVVKSMKELAGMVAIVPIKEGEQITYNKLTEPNMRTGLAPQVTPGRRAVSIPVSEQSSVSKLVKPGDRVDVIAIVEGKGGKENTIAKTVLQDVVVLAVGQNVTNNIPRTIEGSGRNRKVKSLTEYAGFSTVTLEVEPGEVQSVALLAEGGRMYLALRNNDDTDRVGLRGVMFNDVLGPDAKRLQQGRKPASRRRRGRRR